MAFNRKNNKHEYHETLENRVSKLEIDFKRVNTLEVFMKRLLNIENQLLAQSSMKSLAESANERKKISQNTSDLEERIISAVEKRWRKQFVDDMDKLTEHVNTLTNELIKLKQQLLQSETEKQEIHKQLNELKNSVSMNEGRSQQPIIFQDINVDRVLIDKYELNNIAQLGVRDLSGSLNIGAIYGTGIIPSDLAEDFLSTMNEFKKDKSKDEHNTEEQPDLNKENDDEDGMDIEIEE